MGDSRRMRTLSSFDDIRRHFQLRRRSTYFISACNFNMMGMHSWVRGWKNVNMLDCFDGTHPDVVVVPDDHSRAFTGIEDINHYLFDNPGVAQMLRGGRTRGERDQVLFLFFDEALEARCAEMGLEVALPRNRLVREVDSKVVTTKIGNQANVVSVPNILARVDSYARLRSVARQAGLGESLVVQEAYGDSGKTTYFIDSEADYAEHAYKIEQQDSVKVMRRVRCAGTAIEACATRWGTFVGPLLTELIGAPLLTPYPGGWCGNELYADAFSEETRAKVLRMTQSMGDALYQRGYRGYFELDYLVDLDTQDLYLGELNPRITGVSAMTNLSAFCRSTVPLFLFHLLEYDAGVELEMDADAYNQDVLARGAQGVSAQLILKYTDDMLRVVTRAPLSGVYQLDEQGHLNLQQPGYDRLAALAPDQAYVLRISAVGDYAYHGGDLAIMFVNTPIRSAQGALTPQGEVWTRALRACFGYRMLTQNERVQVELARNPANAKSAGGQ